MALAALLGLEWQRGHDVAALLAAAAEPLGHGDMAYGRGALASWTSNPAPPEEDALMNSLAARAGWSCRPGDTIDEAWLQARALECKQRLGCSATKLQRSLRGGVVHALLRRVPPRARKLITGFLPWLERPRAGRRWRDV